MLALGGGWMYPRCFARSPLTCLWSGSQRAIDSHRSTAQELGTPALQGFPLVPYGSARDGHIRPKSLEVRPCPLLV